MIKNVVCRGVFLSLGILLFVVASYGQTTQINGAASGNWSNTASWSPATVPNNGGGNTFNVTLLNSPAVTITLDINPTIDTLTLDLGSELTTDAGTTLTTTGLTNGGVVNFANGNTLTVNGATTNTNEIIIAGASTANFNGNLTNSSTFATSGKSTATVTGAFANNSGGFVDLETTGDVLNVGSLTNNSELIINAGATLNITGGGSGITTVAAGSNLSVAGTLNVINGGTPSNGLANLTTVAGSLAWENGQTLTDAATTLTVASGGLLEIFNGSTLSVTNLTISGEFLTNNKGTVTVSGTFTNNSGAFVELESSGDVLNVGTLTNSGELIINAGATLNITGGGLGITSVAAGSTLDVAGTLNVINGGTPSNGLANLTTVAGSLAWENGQTLTDAATTLTVASGGLLEIFNGSTLSVTNLTISGEFLTNNKGTVTVSGTFTNNSGAFVELESSGDVLNVGTLTNSGEIIIASGATLNITGGGAGITTVVAGSNLIVAGTLNVINGGTPSNGLANLTTVAGNLTLENGQTLTDTPTGGTLSVTGELSIANASKLVVTNVSNSGNFLTSGGSTATASGTFTNNSGALVELESSGDVLNVGALTNSGEIIIVAGSTLNITGGGAGITDVVAGSNLIVAGTLNVINGGTPSSALGNLTTIAGNLTLENGQTVTDTPTGGTLSILTGGLFSLGNASTLSVSNLTSSGEILTSGNSKLTVSGTLTNNNFVELEASGDVLSAGTLTNGSTAIFDVQPGATLNLTGATSSNAGTINLDSGGILEISASKVTISGTGKIILNGAGSVIEGALSADVLTLAKGSTIEGTGNIGNNLMTLNNQGTIDANMAATTLTLQMSGGTTNSGTMEATAGATLQLDAGTYTQTSTGNILASETGNALSAVNLESGVIINGGKLTTTGTTATINLVGATPTLTLNGVSISGTGKLILPDGSTTTLLGTISNTSTIDVNGATAPTKLVVGQSSVTLSGTGKIILTDNANNQFTGLASADTLHNGNTIEGAGNIGEGNMGLINTGTIETLAHQVNTLEIDASSTGFSNQGILLAATGSTLYIDNASNQFLNFSGTTLTGGTYTVDGTLKFDGANIVTNAANITLSGSTSKIIDQSNGDGLANFATNASGGTFALATGRNFTTASNFTNNGTLNIGGGTKFAVGTNGAANLTNFSGTTLTGGTYIVAGTLQFNGANIVTNDASITLSGAAAKIEDQTGANALANFATNGTGSTFALASSAKFNTSGNFTNNGTLNVATGTKFSTGVNGASNLTNYATNTLTGGSYIATGTGQIQFNNEATTGGIKTNAASITLSGATSTASLIDQNGANMLANFATNSSTGSFTLISSRTFTTAAGFTNAGIMQISKTTTFTVGASGNYAQTGGATTVDGTLTVGTAAAVNISGGSLFGNGGTINGNVDLTGGTVNPGDGLNAIGDFKVSGTYIQGSGGTLNIDLNGITPNTKYDVLNITGAATLGGTLNFDLLAGFTPTVGQSFTVINYASETGAFTTVNLPTAPPNTHWTFVCDPTDCTLTLNSGLVAPSPTTTGTVSASPARRVSRSAGLLAPTPSTGEPVAILSHVTCFAARLLGSSSCDRSPAAVVSRGNELHAVASAGSGLGSVHNNVIIASRSIASARGGASHETSVSATAMARFYVCAYLPSSAGHTMGCN